MAPKGWPPGGDFRAPSAVLKAAGRLLSPSWHRIRYGSMPGTGPPLAQMQRTVLDPEQRLQTMCSRNYLLRYNGGGAPSMIQLISSYFFAERKHLNSFYVRASDSWEHFWTQEEVQGPKLVDVPIFILTSGRTFSAAEEFTYNLKNMERATIVGETTGGGAHPVNGRNFDFGTFTITMSVPYGRAVNPTTGTNWEGVGVVPDIAVPADQALDKALQEARRPHLRERDHAGTAGAAAPPAAAPR